MKRSNLNFVMFTAVMTLAVTSSVFAGFIGVLDGVNGNSTFEDAPAPANVSLYAPGDSADPGTYLWQEIGGVNARVFRDAINSNAALIGSSATTNYTVQLDTGISIEALTDYELTVDLGFYTNTYDPARQFSYNVELGTLNNDVFTQLANGSGSVVQTQHFNIGPSGSVVVTLSTDMVVSGDNLAIRLSRTGGYAPAGTELGRYGGFDNVVLTATPEPATVALLAIGSAICGLRRKK